jgi:hypothetical protein
MFTILAQESARCGSGVSHRSLSAYHSEGFSLVFAILVKTSVQIASVSV